MYIFHPSYRYRVSLSLSLSWALCPLIWALTNIHTETESDLIYLFIFSFHFISFSFLEGGGAKDNRRNISAAISRHRLGGVHRGNAPFSTLCDLHAIPHDGQSGVPFPWEPQNNLRLCPRPPIPLLTTTSKFINPHYPSTNLNHTPTHTPTHLHTKTLSFIPFNIFHWQQQCFSSFQLSEEAVLAQQATVLMHSTRKKLAIAQQQAKSSACSGGFPCSPAEQAEAALQHLEKANAILASLGPAFFSSSSSLSSCPAGIVSALQTHISRLQEIVPNNNTTAPPPAAAQLRWWSIWFKIPNSNIFGD